MSGAQRIAISAAIGGGKFANVGVYAGKYRPLKEMTMEFHKPGNKPDGFLR
ncbi:MAG: hypothetical protein FD170_757 [Bacteroidetes bacterium]|nr:MAG: hypothetical protein FD170_757 [Bacteroidota bacterium]